LLAERLRRGDVVVVDSLPLSEGKTQEILRLVKTITGAMEGAEVDLGKSKLLILLNRPEEKLVRAAGNLSNLRVRLLQGVLLADLLWADRLILTAPVAQDVFKEAEKWLVKPSKS
jgi:ribosomal protein L4